MSKRYFGRKVVRAGTAVQVWVMIAGGNWEHRYGSDRFRDEYGPYATQ